MKKIINILSFAVLLIGALASCEKAPKIDESLVGEWQLTHMDGQETSAISTAVYIEFRADKSFDMYQKVGDVSRFRKYTGTYSVAGTILSGEYKDGEEWGSCYKVSVEADGHVLKLTAVTLDDSGAVVSEGEVCAYIKASLSQEEKDASDIMTKSSGSVVFRVL